MKCPCEDCLCVPICGNKVYHKLVECSLLAVYLIGPCTASIRPSNRILKVEEIIQPEIWGCFIKDNRTNLAFIYTKKRIKNEMPM